MKRSTRLLRFLFWIVLLGIGFTVGTAWRNMNAEDTISTEAEVQEIIDTTDVFAAAEARLNSDELATIRLFESTAPSVAFITTTNLRADYFSRNVTEIPRGSGSAFVWDKQGHIITNYHVIQGADRAQVTLADQSVWDASLVGKAPEKDLAVLKIDAPANKLVPIPVGRSANLQVGQMTLAIGNPFGLDQTLTTGIISALGREIESVSGIPIQDVIQTDAAINPGNSGGPLLNSSGELIGVNTAIYSPSGAYAGIGFSIPVDVVKWVVPELIAYGKVQRPSLGADFVPEQYLRRFEIEGVVVYQVEQGGAAERAGIQATRRDRYGRIRLGDIIVAIGEEKVSSENDIVLILENYQPGEVVAVTVLRDEELLDFEVQLDAPE